MSTEKDHGIVVEQFNILGGMEEIRPRYDLVDILLRREGGFNITSLNSSRSEHDLPQIAHRFKPLTRERQAPRLGNFELKDDNPQNEPIIKGLFHIDRENERLLFDPTGILPTYDTYRAWDLGLNYSGSLIDMLRVLTQRGLPLFQMTRVEKLPNLAVESGISKQDAFNQVMRTVHPVQSMYGRSGYNSRDAYQIEGELSIEQILNGELHEIQLIPNDYEAYIAKLTSDWGKQVE